MSNMKLFSDSFFVYKMGWIKPKTISPFPFKSSRHGSCSFKRLLSSKMLTKILICLCTIHALFCKNSKSLQKMNYLIRFILNLRKRFFCLSEESFTALFNPFLFIWGLSCPCNVQASLSLNCLKLTIPRFHYNLLLVSYGDFGFKEKNIDQVLAWKSDYKGPLLSRGPPCPLQPILLSDLVWMICNALGQRSLLWVGIMHNCDYFW